jgi:hypothetical protein
VKRNGEGDVRKKNNEHFIIFSSFESHHLSDSFVLAKTSGLFYEKFTTLFAAFVHTVLVERAFELLHIHGCIGAATSEDAPNTAC